MKSILIVFNQAVSEEVLQLLDDHQIRGFTKMDNLQGRGSNDGDPVMGTHTWPALNNAIVSVVSDDKSSVLIDALNDLNRSDRGQGIKAFLWDAEVVVD
jgi:nitrogen regulatory protein PII